MTPETKDKLRAAAKNVRAYLSRLENMPGLDQQRIHSLGMLEDVITLRRTDLEALANVTALIDRIDELSAALEQATEAHADTVVRVEVLEAALRPFAKWADRFGHGNHDEWQLAPHSHRSEGMTVGHLRRARAALLSAMETETGGEDD